ncbi:MAG TPA: hypothetical protein VFR32_01420, partial [Gaiellaceae bacterium]|nr:hypothetical protein [Gaiellaceae bacterium]
MIGVALVGALALLSPSTARAIDDTTPPELLDFDFAPASVDTSGGSATITVTAHMTDDVAGGSQVTLGFQGPSA